MVLLKTGGQSKRPVACILGRSISPTTRGSLIPETCSHQETKGRCQLHATDAMINQGSWHPQWRNQPNPRPSPFQPVHSNNYLGRRRRSNHLFCLNRRRSSADCRSERTPLSSYHTRFEYGSTTLKLAGKRMDRERGAGVAVDVGVHQQDSVAAVVDVLEIVFFGIEV